MALYTLLSAVELAEALSAYGLPPPERVLPEPKGSINTNYHVWTGGRRWFHRLNEGKTDADVDFEAAVRRFLEAESFPSARLVPAVNGAHSGPARGKLAMLFAFVDGVELVRADVTPDHCRVLGRELGRLHSLSARFRAHRENPYRWSRVESWMRDIGPDGGGDAEVRPWVPMLQEEMERSRALPPAPQGLVHGDPSSTTRYGPTAHWPPCSTGR